MRNELRLSSWRSFSSSPSAAALADQSAPSSSGPLLRTPAGGASGAPPQLRRRRRAARRQRAPAKEPIITTMPMDVPSGTELILTLETPVSSETAKPDQPVRATSGEAGRRRGHGSHSAKARS